MIGNAACEPHVQDLCRFLVALGARIDGIGSNVLRIEGVEQRSAAARTGSARSTSRWRASSASPPSRTARSRSTTPSPTTWRRSCPCFARLGVRRRDRGHERPRARRAGAVVVDDLGGQIPKIEDGAWPAFPADLTSIAVVARDAGARARSSSSRRCSRAGCSSSTSSSGWARGSSSATRTAWSSRPREALRPADGEPRHPRRHGDADRRPVRRGHVDDRQHRPDRPRLRADRRAPARARGPD